MNEPIDDKRLDQIESAFQKQIIAGVALTVAVVERLGPAVNDEFPAAGYMMGLFQGLTVGLNDPAVARAVLEVYDRRVWPESDKAETFGIEKLVARVRKIIGFDA